jgi:hypothetical protein
MQIVDHVPVIETIGPSAAHRSNIRSTEAPLSTTLPTVIDAAVFTTRVVVDSSLIESAGYSREHAVLDVKFRRGTLYRFFVVPEAVFHDLLRAESKGAFFNRHVRGRFSFQRLRG